MNSKQYQDAWDKRVGEGTAHIDGHINAEALNRDYYKIATDGASLKKKVVIDYGCGGGLFGKYLKTKRIDKYVGIDISERSLTAAKKLLGKEAILIKIDPYEFPDLSILTADYLFCMNVIQHFPSKEYLDGWLDNINRSGIKNIVLQCRHGEMYFQPDPYKTTHEINMANTIPKEYIISKLTNYKFAITIYNSGWFFGKLN